jgi:hypothetical protein
VKLNQGMPWRKQLPLFFETCGRRHVCAPQKTQIFSNTTVRTSNVPFRKMLIYCIAMWFAPCHTTILKDCLLQAVRDWLFNNVLAPALRCPEGVFSIGNRRTHHVIAEKDPFNVTIKTIVLVFSGQHFIFVVILIFHIITTTTNTILIFLFIGLPVSYLLT